MSLRQCLCGQTVLWLSYLRINNSNQTVYADTLALPAGCYRLVVEDAGCDGLRWWANPNQGTGTLQVRNSTTNTFLSLKGYSGGDFGCGFTQAFRVQTALGINDQVEELLLTVYPNPANEQFTVSFTGQALGTDQHKVELYDALGKQVFSAQTQQQSLVVPVQKMAAGMYMLKYANGDKRAQKKIVVAH